MCMYTCTFELYCFLCCRQAFWARSRNSFPVLSARKLYSIQSQHHAVTIFARFVYFITYIPGLIVGFVLIVYYCVYRNVSRVLSRLTSAVALIADINLVKIIKWR